MADDKRKLNFEEIVGEMLNCLNPPGDAATICPKCKKPATVFIVNFGICGACFIAAQHEGEPIQ